MSNQIQATGDVKIRSLNGALTATSGIVSSVPLGAANGVATLDSTGKVPITQLPSSIMEYKGTWNAATNTPTLANGTGDPGDLYICNVAGTTNFGAGPITFAVGDWVIYNGSIWQKSNGSTGTVTSVAVTESSAALNITGSPITTAGTINIGFAGTSAQYVAGDGSLVTFPSLSGYVPYTGATADVDLGSHKLSLNSEQFASISAPSYSEGALWYDSTQKALAYYNDISGNILHIGQEVQLKVHNNTGATIAKGAPVYVTSTSSGYSYPNVALAKADTLTTANVIGLANQAIATGTDGYITLSGLLTGANTGSFTVGDVLYLSPYSAGQLMNTMPPTGYAVRVGVVSYSNTPNGTIYINQSNAFSTAANIVGTIQISQGGTGATTAAAALSNLGGIGLTSLSASSPLSYNNTTGAFSISQANGTTNGYLSSTDWNIFNGKQNALGFTPIGGTGSTNYISKFTGSTTIGNSGIYEGVSGKISINNTNTTYALDVTGVANFSNVVYASSFITNSSAGILIGTDGGGNGGSLLFTQNTSTTVAAPGQSSISTSSTNIFRLQSGISSGVFKAFQFDNSALTNNTVRTYTMPDASGTLALSSDLSGYVTLSTTQTISGNKSFTYGISFTGGIGFPSTVGGTSYGSISGNSSFFQIAAQGGSTILIKASSGTNALTIDTAGNVNFGSTIGNGTYIYTLPSASGTLALTSQIPSLSGYVPYSGATSNLDLGSFYITVAGANRLWAGAGIANNSLAIGNGVLISATTGGGNIAIGVSGLSALTTGNYNASVGWATGTSLTTGSENMFFGNGAGYGITTGTGNIDIANRSVTGTSYGSGVTTGSYNTIIGRATGLSASTSNNIILADGQGNIRYQYDSYNNNNFFGNLQIYKTTTSSLGFNLNSNGSSFSEIVSYGPSTGIQQLNVSGSKIVFLTGTAGGGSWNEKMRLNTSGNFSIGNTNDTYNLDVTGTGRFTTSATTPLIVQTTSGNSGIQILTSATTTNWLVGAQYNVGNGFEITPSTTNGGTTFSTPALVVKSSGNVGIGTNSPSYLLHVSAPSGISYIGNTATSGNNAIIRQYSGTTQGDFGVDATGPYIDQLGGVFRFYKTGGEAMRITSGGGLYVNTTAPFFSTSRFSVKQTTGDPTAEIWSAWAGDQSTGGLYIIKYDNVNTTSQVFQRFVINNGSIASGQINANGALQAAFGGWSDRRLKENIVELEPQLDKILALKPSEFDYKDGSGHQIGFIAQEIQEVYPDVVGADADGMLMVTGWNKTEARLVKAIQELNEKITKLENK